MTKQKDGYTWGSLDIPVTQPREHMLVFDEYSRKLDVTFIDGQRRFAVSLPESFANYHQSNASKVADKAWKMVRANSPWAGYITMWEQMCR